MPERKVKWQFVPAAEIVPENVILVRESGGDLYTPYDVEEVVQTTEGVIVFKVRSTRGDVIAKARYIFPQGARVCRRFA